MKVKIYHLSCPITGEIKYIGGTTVPDLRIRLSGHLSGISYNKKKMTWIKSLKVVNKKPIITEIECVIMSKARARENYWINFYKKQGSDLFNVIKNVLKNKSNPYKKNLTFR